MEEVVRKCEYGIDSHAGSDDRTNLPQIRAMLDAEEARRYSRAFAAPVTIDARLRDGPYTTPPRRRSTSSCTKTVSPGASTWRPSRSAST